MSAPLPAKFERLKAQQYFCCDGGDRQRTTNFNNRKNRPAN